MNKISNWKELNSAILELKNKDDISQQLELLSKIDLSSTKFSEYKVHVVGKNCNATINASFANAVIDFQKNIDTLCKSVKKNYKPSDNQLQFKIENGSTIFDVINLSEVINNNFVELVKTMTPEQITLYLFMFFAFVGGTKIVGTFIGSIFDYFKSKNQIKSENELRQSLINLSANSQDLVKDIIAISSNQKVLSTLKKTEEISKNIKSAFLKNAPINDIDSIEINEDVYGRSDILASQQPESYIESTYQITEDFIIDSLKLNQAKIYKMTVRFSSNNKPTNSFELIGKTGDLDLKSYLDSNDMKNICEAISKNHKKIKMTAIIKFRNGIPYKGDIVQVFNEKQQD